MEKTTNKTTTKPTNKINDCFIKKIRVTYNDKQYYVLTIKSNKNNNLMELPFVIDYDDFDKIKEKTWFLTSWYICSSYMIKKVKYTEFLHRELLNQKFDGKAYIDHINRIHQDNRRVNLRFATQSEQNWNQSKRKRNLKLPDACGFVQDDIPTNVEYHQENGGELTYFEVVIKVDGKRIYRKKTTKSKKVTLLQKLNESKDILKSVMEEHPEWFENRCINGHLSKEGDMLYEEYFAILKLANVHDPINEYVSADIRNKKFV